MPARGTRARLEEMAAGAAPHPAEGRDVRNIATVQGAGRSNFAIIATGQDRGHDRLAWQPVGRPRGKTRVNVAVTTVIKATRRDQREERMMQIARRLLLKGAAAGAVGALAPALAAGRDMTGVSDTEIKIGSTTSLSGPVSALGVQDRVLEAYFRMINEQGGVAGRKIDFIYYDDAFQPPKTVEMVRRLLESDRVSFLFNMLGTAPNSAVVDYINHAKVPHLFLSVNGSKWGDYKRYPWTMGFAPSARTEAQVYAKYALQQKADGRFAVLYQNDDLGKDYLAGVRDVLGSQFETRVKAVAHEVSAPTVDSEIITLQASGADFFLAGSTAKFVAQSIRKTHELGWNVTRFIASGAASINGVIKPAGFDRAVGVISSAYLKDPSDPAWANDQGIADYLRFMQERFASGNPSDLYCIYGYTLGLVMMQVLRQAADDLSRENIMRQAENLKDLDVPTLLPGIKVNTSPTDHRPLEQLQLQRWDGAGWRRFGAVIEGSSI